MEVLSPTALGRRKEVQRERETRRGEKGAAKEWKDGRALQDEASVAAHKK